MKECDYCEGQAVDAKAVICDSCEEVLRAIQHRLSPAVRELLIQDPAKLDADVRLLMPMTPEEAEAAFDAAEPVSLSNERVEEILANVMRRDRRQRL